MIRIALLAAASFAVASAQAQVFKCADANGRITYSQNPCPANTKRETMSRGGIPLVPVTPSPEGAADKAAKSDAAKSGPKTPAEQEQAFRKRLQDQAKAAKEAEQKNAQAQAKEANCRNARQRLAQYSIGGRIARTDEQGERYYMDDAQIEAERARAQTDVSQLCS